MDQASTLREITQNGLCSTASSAKGGSKPTNIICVSSGKGGVGKSNFVLNTAIVLRQYRKKVLVMDADMGLGNIDVLIGKATPYNLSHVFRQEKALEEIIAPGPCGIHFLPAASGVEWITSLSTEQKMDFLQKMDALNGRYDILLIDTGAGISSNVTYFNLAAQTRIILVTPEPTSLTDAYALMKVLNRNYQQDSFEIVVNSVSGEKEALEVYRTLTAAADRFLNLRLGYLGSIVRDHHLPQAVMRRQAVMDLYPSAPVAESYRALAKRIARISTDVLGNNLGVFWRKIVEDSRKTA